MKRLIAATLAAVMLLSCTAYAQTNIVYNDSVIQYNDQEPVIIGERTYVPVRGVFANMGFSVDWDAENKVVSLDNDYYTAYINTNNNVLLVMDEVCNVKGVKLQDEVKIINGRTMLPLRELLESLGYEIEWDAETKSSVIKDANDYASLDAEYEALEQSLSSEEDSYVFDSSKPEGSFTDEELAYLMAVTKGLGDISSEVSGLNGKDVDVDELAPVIISKASVVFSAKCPDSLGDFGTELEKGLKEGGLALYSGAKAVQMFTDGMDSSSIDGAMLTLSVYMRIMARLASDIKPASDILSGIMKERNINPESVTNLVQELEESDLMI